MAEKRSALKSRKSPRKIPGKVQFSEGNSEDAAQRRAALENAIRKKIETEKRALQIVERLLENDITEDFLMDCAKFISPSYYKDIVEERSIVKLCGYPICNKKLENVPKQKYKISTKTNKVYDITERKCFCSNFCYRASKYYEAQIPQTPVWSREEEIPPVIKLFKQGRSGSSGEEVILTDRHITMSEVENPERATEGSGNEDGECEQVFVSSVIAEQSPKDMDGGDVTQEETPEMAQIDRYMDDATEKMTRCSLNDNGRSCDLLSNPDTDAKVGSEAAESPESPEVVTEVTRRAVSKSGAERLRKLLCKSKSYEGTRRADVSPVVVKKSVLDVLTQTLTEWRTENTLKYLFGTHYIVQREVSDAGADQGQDLDEDDLDDVEDPSPVNDADLKESLPYESNNSVSKPLPDYAKLREETKMQEIRVREFFGGHYVLPKEAESDKPKEKKEMTSWAPPLPLVDSCSQQQVRRRIVLEKLKKVLPAILIKLQISYSDVSKELNDLVKTFRFTNTNISHALPEWSIIAIVLLSVSYAKLWLQTVNSPLNVR
ncbi:putative RNA polymerase II subunit B1 CTD phosphatase RPAP2 [Hyla sarda]|uniref:putative RNA polymerase II subunit B1 CTD phosphatase RPAP2 n=1 Tax=Hyla sarda TaxID=327740 RepID=UPI0024C22352|nr:putative RNA polymerase II subunit B1 CTD phosphatase RPAP2 [Hyla sarda]